MSERLSATPALIGMAAGLALFYWGDALPLAPLPQLLGLAIFVELAFLRADLALLAVPFTAPLYLIPAALPGLRAEPLRLPLHEAALLATAAAVAARWAWDRRARSRERGAESDSASPTSAARPGALRFDLRRYLPHALFLLAGLAGVALAVPEGRGAALRELRWLVVEPLLLYALLRRSLADEHQLGAGGRAALVTALVLSGVLVAALGLLQAIGVDLVPLLGEKQSFSENVVEAGGALRVASVYGHPNNLGLYLGRVWPLAAALALLAGGAAGRAGQRAKTWLPGRAPFALAALVCLAGILVSLSRGAWIGAVAAAAVLALGVRGAAGGERRRRRGAAIAVGAVVALAAVGSMALALRGGVGGGSLDARVLLWREALALIQAHPLGLGLDQFYYYHNPEFGRSIIDPSLVGTSEQYASHPHNLLLDAWLNVGPIGLAALGWLVVRFYRQGFAALRRAPDAIALGALAAMTAGLVHGTVDVFYFVEDLAIVFWLLLALAEASEETG